MKPALKDMYHEARLRLLIEAKLDTDEDHILESLTKAYLNQYIDGVVAAIAAIKTQKPERGPK